MEYKIYTLGKDGKYWRYGNLAFSSATANKSMQKCIDAGLNAICVSHDSRYGRRRIKTKINGNTYVSKYVYLDRPEYAEGIHNFVLDNMKDYQKAREFCKNEYDWEMDEIEFALSHANNAERLILWLYQHDYIKTDKLTGTV